jgi:hypothetical protein
MLLMAKPAPNSTIVKHRRPYLRLAHPRLKGPGQR